jgi:hypothetical protein
MGLRAERLVWLAGTGRLNVVQKGPFLATCHALARAT